MHAACVVSFLLQTQLSTALAQRNKQLQEAQASIAALQKQLLRQQRDTEAQVEAASSRHKLAAAKAAKDKEETLKAVLQLEVGGWLGWVFACRVSVAILPWYTLADNFGLYGS